MKDKKSVKDGSPVWGLVVRGSRNIFSVRLEGMKDEIECRFKGKILKCIEGYYNPLAPGDLVEIEDGLITGLKERRNQFVRFNQKGQAPQLLAANVDFVVCVTSLSSPPFRPRFLDRLLLQADTAGIPALIVCNKYDLDSDPDVEERLSDFERIGYKVFRISVLSGEGLDEFKNYIKGKLSVLVGQSGVGKSSLVNALMPGLEMKTGTLNEKFNRGKHTTTQGVLLEAPCSDTSFSFSRAVTRIVDTPGIRRFALAGIQAEDIVLGMKEFAPLAGKCSYGLSCSHETEPGCKIMEAVSAGVIHEDRYESYLRIRRELTGET